MDKGSLAIQKFCYGQTKIFM